MAKADIVSVHTPLTPETRGLIGAEEIGAMKQGGILINTSRGPVVDTDALAAALKEGRIKAGTDVFEKDPPLPEDHPLLGVPNLVCTPHVGFDTRESHRPPRGNGFREHHGMDERNSGSENAVTVYNVKRKNRLPYAQFRQAIFSLDKFNGW